MRYLYSALLYFLFPLVLLRMLFRSWRAPEYRRRLAQRFGFFAPGIESAGPVIWLHAVSVGEVMAAVPLLHSLLADDAKYTIVVTTTTPTGSQRVRALFGERVFHVYAPWDLPGSVRRFLRQTRPQLLLLMETELWPNMLRQSQKEGCKVILCNARMSQRSAQGYQRVAKLTHSMLTSIDAVACASEADADRFLSLGVSPQRLLVTGNLKFDLTLTDSMRTQAMQHRERFGAQRRPVLLAASTHAGEEQYILDAFRWLRDRGSNCLLLLVPRHPERCAEVATLCEGQGWNLQRHSAGNSVRMDNDIVLVDTVGDLTTLYGAATVAFIGGSFVQRGGHNPLEAAVWGVPTVSGPSVFNFAQVSGLLAAADAMTVLHEVDQLGPCLEDLMNDSAQRNAMGDAAQLVVAQNRGALKRLLEVIEENLAAT
jgi:3-deoxy-D-manno-octulosonic-acid transferase